ncbi:MAG: hypothetical protein QOC84_633 [Bradyrhizobium sp.]|jgi:hypothetical protein|nr:hypothetical protein [Bradyrhizobium sp.]
MLPGFRFLFAAVMVSMSILIFGLGAAALLRAAHEEVASNPAWHSGPATLFAQQGEATGAVLALLRVEPPAEPKAPDNAPAADAPVAAVPEPPQEPDAVVPAPEAIVPAPEPQRLAALKPEEPSPPEAAKPEIPIPEAPAPHSEPVPAQTDAPAAAGETKIAAIQPEVTEPVSPLADQNATTAYEPMTVPGLPGAKTASTKVAALGHARAKVAAPRHAKTASAKHDTTVNASAEAKEKEKRLQELRAKRRRIAAARARIARQQAEQLQPANPFAPYTPPAAQPVIQPAR